MKNKNKWIEVTKPIMLITKRCFPNISRREVNWRTARLLKIYKIYPSIAAYQIHHSCRMKSVELSAQQSCFPNKRKARCAIVLKKPGTWWEYVSLTRANVNRTVPHVCSLTAFFIRHFLSDTITFLPSMCSAQILLVSLWGRCEWHL